MDTNLPLCVFCKTVKTKYRCVNCDAIACNVCTVPVDETHIGYDEDFKKVGLCGNCSLKKPEPTRKKVQSTLLSLFNKSNKRSNSSQPSAHPAKKRKTECDLSSTS